MQDLQVVSIVAIDRTDAHEIMKHLDSVIELDDLDHEGVNFLQADNLKINWPIIDANVVSAGLGEAELDV